MAVYESSDGAWRVVQVVLSRSGHTPRTLLRVTYHGFLVADCATVDEVVRHVSLDLLHPVDDEADGD